MRFLRKIERLGFCALGALAIAAPFPLSAQDSELQAPESQTPKSQTIEQLRARDRLAPPAGELDVWQAFAARVLADPSADPTLRAEAYLGRSIARYYAKQFGAGWADIEAAEKLGVAPNARASFTAELLSYGALHLVELGRLDDAQSYAGRSLKIAETRGEAGFGDLALAYNAIGGIAFAQNDLAGAETGYCTARDFGIRAAKPDHAMIVNDASSCGALKFYLERPDTRQAMQLAADHAFAFLPSDHPKMGNVLNSAYSVLIRYGRYGEAEPLIRRHLDLELALHGPDADNIYDPLSMLGRALELGGKLDEAEVIFRAAAELADRLKDKSQPYTRGISRSNLARVLANQDRLEEAEVEARGGLDRLIADLEPTDYHIGSGQMQLADHMARLGRPEEALGLVTSGLALLEAALPEGHSEVLLGRLIQARILSRLGNQDEALDIARQAARSFSDRFFDLRATETDIVSLSEILPQAYGDYLMVALRANAPDDAAEAAQLRLLSELALSNGRIKAGALARGQGLGEAMARLEQGQAQAEALSAKLTKLQAESGADNAAELAEISVQLTLARTEAELARFELERDFPEFLALARPQPADLAELQAGLGEDELLVLPVSLDGRAVTIAIGRNQFEWAETEISAKTVGETAARLRASAQQTGAFDYQAASDLYRVVFPEELQPLLAQKSNLLFPASGYLARISPAMLLTSAPALDEENGQQLQGAPWLLRSHSVEIIADPAEKRSAQSEIAGGSFLGIGAPNMMPSALSGGDENDYRDGLNLPPLPRAKEELEALAKALGPENATILANDDATEERFLGEDLKRYGVIAFATHGLVGGEIPGLSEPALLLSATDQGRESGDGLLTASEISGLSLDADWVILSACETASGNRAGAPSYSGLARAFVQAGARALMLSHWRVRDDASARLSVETVRGTAAGLNRAEALRQAQLSLMADASFADGAHPAIWAPFVIVEN